MELPRELEEARVSVEPENREAAPGALGLEVTPTEAHFARCHFAVPGETAQAIAIGGAVADPASVRLDELHAMERRTLLVTLECAGNGRVGMQPLPPGEPWRRGAVSTAVWSGVPLAALLERAGLRDDVVEILVTGADRGATSPGAAPIAFERSLPRERALDSDVLIATEMNGAPIPPLHGGPARLIVPGWYGMASVKWVEAITALTAPFDGHFQSRAYVYGEGEPVTAMRVRAAIVAPAEGAVLAAGRFVAWGWAWSGDAAIDAVEVSLDAGPYRAATLAPPSAPHAWTRWHLELEAARRGRHTLRARARDRAGHVQPDAPVWNRLGYGNHSVETRVLNLR